MPGAAVMLTETGYGALHDADHGWAGCPLVAMFHDVSVGEILEGALGIEPAKWTKGDQMRVGAWLKSRDWERYRSGAAPTREWRYRRLQHG